MVLSGFLQQCKDMQYRLIHLIQSIKPKKCSKGCSGNDIVDGDPQQPELQSANADWCCLGSNTKGYRTIFLQ